MQVTEAEHRRRPWRIHELLPDFRLEDAWVLPARGGADEFPLLVAGFATADSGESPSRIARLLWKVRWTAGRLLGWDDDAAGVGGRVTSLRERLPEDLRAASPGPTFDHLPFSPLYLLDDECAAEIANATMHGVMHLGWVPDGDGGFHGEMAVYVRTNGRLGDAYMAAIRPFRHHVVYPPMLKQVEQLWERRDRLVPAA